MCKKGRHWLQGNGEFVTGEKNANAKLTWKDVESIRAESKSGASGPFLAKKFGVCHPNIYDIIHNRTWVVNT
jgi:hypothetical protein